MFELSLRRLFTVLLMPMVMAGCEQADKSGHDKPFLERAAEAQADLSRLNDRQLAFLSGEAPLMILAGQDKLLHELSLRSPEQVERFVSDLMEVTERLAYRPGIDMPAIPLNREANNFNGSMTPRPDALWERRRDPGPVHVSRYVRGRGGVPTFAGAPVAVTPADLIAGQVEVAIAGIPQGFSSGNRDAHNGPNALRISQGIADRDVFVMADPGAVLNIVDYGNFSVDRMALERSVEHLVDMVSAVAMTSAVPFLVGGDATVTYSAVRGVREALERELTLVHLGAHVNLAPVGSHTLSDSVVLTRLLDEGIVEGRQLIQLGLRGPSAGEADFRRLRDLGVRYHTMAEVERKGWEAVMGRVLSEAAGSGNPVYISLDVSVLDTSELPAAGRAVPGGLRIRELQPLLRQLCRDNQVAGFEIMDLAPMLDRTYVSAINANYLMNACLAGMAQRKLDNPVTDMAQVQSRNP